MGLSYSMDLREGVLQDCDNAMSSEGAGRKYSVAIATVYSWRKRQHRPQGISTRAKPQTCTLRKRSTSVGRAPPDATLEELHAK